MVRHGTAPFVALDRSLGQTDRLHRLVQRGTSLLFSEGRTEASFRLTGTETVSGWEGRLTEFDSRTCPFQRLMTH